MLHLELHRITRTINTAYYAQIILQLTSHFIQMICCFCSVYYLSKIRTSPTPKSVEFFITLIWIVIFTIKVTVLSHVCDRVSTEAQKIGRIIQEIDYYSTNVEVREEVHQITMQMILNPVHLTACGFFRLNRSLISKFFGSICTYVFIIIQMSDS
ncbi:putative gustatory receptor 94a [Prorops nasuta]|uniref:putative gustatory receptor 94a n=1 Tax=Prorops nasuta TaxID=863751 RepID=UPI0034CDCE54